MGQADAEHPTQGWLPFGKLDWQPPTQLPDSLSSFLSRSMTDPCPPGCAAVAGGLSCDTVWRCPLPRPTARCTGTCGLVTCLGAWTVMLGSALLPEESVAAMTVPQKPNNSSAMDEIAKVRFEKKRDENFTVMSPRSGGAGVAFLARPIRPRLARRACLCPGLSTSLSAKKEEKHYWKCPMYLTNFRSCPF
jgi:hypothetical protein